MTPKDARDAEPDRMASIVDSAKDAIIGYTPDGIIDIWNAGAERVFGYPAVQILGKSPGFGIVRSLNRLLPIF